MRTRSYQYRQRLALVAMLLLLLGCAPATPVAQPSATPVARPPDTPVAPTAEPDAESFFHASIQVSALTVQINQTIVVTTTLIDSTPPPHSISFGARLYQLCIRTIPADMTATPVPGALGPDDSCIASQDLTRPTPIAPILTTSALDRSSELEGRNWIETYRLRAVRPGTVTLTFGVNGEMTQGRRLWITTYGATSPQIRVVASANATPAATPGR